MATVATLRAVLPRIYELKDASPVHPDAYFNRLEGRCAEHETVLWHYRRLERELAGLDAAAWVDLKRRALDVIAVRVHKRGWQPLFDVFSEAKGFNYLRHIGASDVRFIPKASKRTPDLECVCRGASLLCEVKTLNVSEDEVDIRDRVYNHGEMIGGQTPLEVSEGFLGKVSSTINSARDQLLAHDCQRRASWMVFTVVHFDDWVGHCQDLYFEQIDRHLDRNPMLDVELVFSPASNVSRRALAMTAATLYERGDD